MIFRKTISLTLVFSVFFCFCFNSFADATNLDMNNYNGVHVEVTKNTLSVHALDYNSKTLITELSPDKARVKTTVRHDNGKTESIQAVISKSAGTITFNDGTIIKIDSEVISTPKQSSHYDLLQARSSWYWKTGATMRYRFSDCVASIAAATTAVGALFWGAGLLGAAFAESAACVAVNSFVTGLGAAATAGSYMLAGELTTTQFITSTMIDSGYGKMQYGFKWGNSSIFFRASGPQYKDATASLPDGEMWFSSRPF